MEGKKFTLGAALLFEEVTGKTVTDMGTLGLADMLAMLYAQEFWNVTDRPSFDEFKAMAGAWDISELTQRLNGPFSQPAAQ
jgi:hypothetical protein